jgi:non-ribosomal peptide synthetase component F
VILRTNLGGDPNSREVLRRVRATAVAAFDHQDLPFEELAEILERDRAIRPASLAQIMVLLQNASLRPPAKGTFACEEANPNMISPLVTTTTYDVILAMVENSLGLVGTCIYKPHLFSAGEIDRLLQDFESVIQQMTAQPERPISEICIRE